MKTNEFCMVFICSAVGGITIIIGVPFIIIIIIIVDIIIVIIIFVIIIIVIIIIVVVVALFNLRCPEVGLGREFATRGSSWAAGGIPGLKNESQEFSFVRVG